jgi:signal transduction histidine kinase
MFRSLRFRLPALFLVGFAVAVLVSTAVALRLFQDYTEELAVEELRREAVGLTELYQRQAGLETDPQSRFRPDSLEKATGDLIFYVGVREGISLFPGAETGLRRLPPGTIDVDALPSKQNTAFEFTPPDRDRTYLAIARPLELGDNRFGAFVVARPKADVRERWTELLQRLALALAGGLLVAALLGLYLSRRITEPLLALSRAADEVAKGKYDVAVPEVRERDEIGHLAERFRQMASRLSAADQRERNFLMSVSHELRTPLTAIRGHVEALREGVVEDPELRADSLDVISVEAQRLERLVGDVLDLAKLDAHRFTVFHEEVDMGRLCEQAYQAFGEEARRRAIDYRQHVRSQPVIVSDGDRVLQIISNLLTNAFRWTPDGGSIELSLGSDNGAVSVDVSDNGPGIKPEEQERIFRPFWSRDGSGTGLGLTIANELAVALGGRVEVRSEVGKGSRFRLVLPVGGPGERYWAVEPERRSSIR